MNKPVFILILLIFPLFTFGQQNLVPNPSFEEYYTCPTAPGSVGDDQLERCKFWYKPNQATTDYYNACQTDVSTGVNVPNNWFGHQEAFDEVAYVGIGVFIDGFSETSEYIQIRLIKQLESCKTYQVRFWLSLSDFSARATNTVGARLDNQPITVHPPFDFNGFELPPHIASTDFITDTLNWVLISGVYKAKGGEEFLTIGRFLDTSQFSNNNVPNVIVNCDSCFQGFSEAYYYIDSVSVVEKSEIQANQAIPNVLTADNNEINDYWYPKDICYSNWTCTIINRWGNNVYFFKESDIGWNGSDTNGDKLDDGVYFYRISNGIKELTGYIHLVR